MVRTRITFHKTSNSNQSKQLTRRRRRRHRRRQCLNIIFSNVISNGKLRLKRTN